MKMLIGDSETRLLALVITVVRILTLIPSARMATPGKSAKKAGKKYIPVKTSLNTPFNSTWSPLPQHDMHFILKTLQDKILSAGLVKQEVKVFRPWRKKKEQNPPPPAPEAIPPASQDAPKKGWSDVAARRQLAIGINEVTKALERNQLRLLLVCKSVRPKHMTDHLIALSATRGVPACQVPRLSQSLSEPLGLRSVLALGFRRGAAQDEELFTDTVEAIKPKVPSLDVAWLRDAALSLKLAPPKRKKMKDEEEVEVGEGEKSKKRKLETESEVVTQSSSSATLQPLKVKRVMANPTRRSKKKKKRNS